MAVFPACSSIACIIVFQELRSDKARGEAIGVLARPGGIQAFDCCLFSKFCLLGAFSKGDRARMADLAGQDNGAVQGVSTG